MPIVAFVRALSPALLAAALLHAAERPALPKPTFDAAEAGEACLPVGEYRGELAGGRRFGAQIAACGAGTMRLVLWPGGLPGDGADAAGRLALPGKRADGAAEFAGEGWSATWRAGTLAVVAADGGRAEFARVERASPTLGAKPPPGAIVIFDGQDRGEFRRSGGIRDGTIGPGWDSKRLLGDADVHVEFLIPFQDHSPDDTNVRLNSTVSFQLDRREGQQYGAYTAIVVINNAMGAVATNAHAGALLKAAAPLVNMSYPPLRWQTFDIEYRHGDSSGTPPRPARVTVRHNGVVVQDGVALPPALLKLAAQQRGPELAFIHTAAHGWPVRFRNVWAVERTPAPAGATEPARP